jgi:hypothetical protein
LPEMSQAMQPRNAEKRIELRDLADESSMAAVQSLTLRKNMAEQDKLNEKPSPFPLAPSSARACICTRATARNYQRTRLGTEYAIIIQEGMKNESVYQSEGDHKYCLSKHQRLVPDRLCLVRLSSHSLRRSNAPCPRCPPSVHNR